MNSTTATRPQRIQCTRCEWQGTWADTKKRGGNLSSDINDPRWYLIGTIMTPPKGMRQVYQSVCPKCHNDGMKEIK